MFGSFGAIILEEPAFWTTEIKNAFVVTNTKIYINIY